MGNELQRLQGRHLQMAELHLTGHTNREIATAMDCTPESVGMVLASPIMQLEISRRRAIQTAKIDQAIVEQVTDGTSVIKMAEVRAAEKMVGLMENFDPKIQLQAAKDILDRAGIGRGVDSRPVVSLSADKVQLLIVAMQESKLMEKEAA